MTGPQGRSYSGSTSRAPPSGQMAGWSVAANTSAWQAGHAAPSSAAGKSAFAGRSFAGDAGLCIYHFRRRGGPVHHLLVPQLHRSPSRDCTHGVRRSWAFHPAWYAAHPGVWYAAGWNTAAVAWRPGRLGDRRLLLRHGGHRQRRRTDGLRLWQQRRLPGGRCLPERPRGRDGGPICPAGHSSGGQGTEGRTLLRTPSGRPSASSLSFKATRKLPTTSSRSPSTRTASSVATITTA